MTPLEALEALDLWCGARQRDKDAWTAIVRAALQPHQVVTTATELDALPMGAVIVDGQGSPLEAVEESGRRLWDWIARPEWVDPQPSADLLASWPGPFIVVWTPPQDSPHQDPTRPTGAPTDPTTTPTTPTTWK